MAEDKGGMAKGLIIGFIAGAVAGAITALLYAPKSGKELRSDIKDKANSLKEDAGAYLNTVRSKASDAIAKAKVRVDHATENILNDAEKMLQDVRERATDESDRVKAAFRAGVDTYKNEKRG